MAYETEEQYISANHTKGRPGLDMLIFFIVHTYNGKGRSLKNYFQTNSLGVSAHEARFLDGKGEQYVRDEDTSHGAGNWWANVRGYNIEHQDNGNPSDIVRTAEQYEGTSQRIAKKAYKFGHKVLNSSNIKPHWEFSSTGCPGGLDIERIRRRSNELLQLILTPPDTTPKWKKEAIDLGPLTFKAQKDIHFVNIENGSVIKTFPEGTEITVRYFSNNYYITEYSYNNTISAGFFKHDVEYIKPDEIVYVVLMGDEVKEDKWRYSEQADAEAHFDEKVLSLKEGEEISLIKWNITKDITETLKHFSIPVKPRPTKLQMFANFIKKVLEFFRTISF